MLHFTVDPKYIGTYTYNRTYIDEITQQKKTELIKYENVIEPIVTKELFKKASQRIEQNKHTKSRKQDKKDVEFLLSGKLR